MEGMKKKWNKYLGSKDLVRSRSTSEKSGDEPVEMMKKSKSLNSGSKLKNRRPVTPEGCFAVYVGPERQRFVVKTEFANHPLFKMLLEDAEVEYGYNSQGPIELPCEVGMFYHVLAEMDGSDGLSHRWTAAGEGGGLNSCSPLRLSRSGSRHGSRHGGGYYRQLSPSSMLKLNGF